MENYGLLIILLWTIIFFSLIVAAVLGPAPEPTLKFAIFILLGLIYRELRILNR